MKIYKKTTVFEEALNRIRYLFDEFNDIVVGVSGGKDSTVVFNLVLMVAKEKNRLPITVLFLDQEIEWEATIDQIKKIMCHPDVKPMWLQIPFKLFNATSFTEHWLNVWDEDVKDKWIREKDKLSIKENTYDEDRFASMFPAIFKKEFKDKPACYIAGVRAKESPSRFMAVTSDTSYKGESWGRVLNKEMKHYTFYPIYDWSYLDVWKAIHDNKWEYNKIYDYQYQYGVPIQEMRVSNLHHETAVHSLFYLQEVEPETYDKVVTRLKGIDAAGKMGTDDFFIKELPFMFKDWREYRDFLLEKLIDNDKWKNKFTRRFATMDRKYEGIREIDKMYKMQIQSILTNDWEMIKIKNWESTPRVAFFRRWKKTGVVPRNSKYATAIPI